MSHTKIPTKVVVNLWMLAAGRCEFRGCNEELWQDKLTLTRMNNAHVAHIISDSPDGPRGDPILSEKHNKDLSNLMLLCKTHHDMVDDDKRVVEFPVELLRQYKLEHEDRIRRLTAIHPSLPTEVILFGTKISEHQAQINYEMACNVITPKRYPASDRPIALDLTSIKFNEHDAEFWDSVPKLIDRGIRPYLDDNIGPSGRPIEHLSVFALAPIPALIYLGKKIGDKKQTDVYQLHRHPVGWNWVNHEDDIAYEFDCTPSPDNGIDIPIVINLSLSNPIQNQDIERHFSVKPHIYRLSITQPVPDFLQTQKQLTSFVKKWRQLLSVVLSEHGNSGLLHLFAAVPNSIAVEIGRSLMKVDRPMALYERLNGTFHKVLTIQP